MHGTCLAPVRLGIGDPWLQVKREESPVVESLDCLAFFFFLKEVSFIFWPLCLACGIFVPRPGIEPAPWAVKAQSLSHWTIGSSLRYYCASSRFGGVVGSVLAEDTVQDWQTAQASQVGLAG